MTMMISRMKWWVGGKEGTTAAGGGGKPGRKQDSQDRRSGKQQVGQSPDHGQAAKPLINPSPVCLSVLITIGHTQWLMHERSEAQLRSLVQRSLPPSLPEQQARLCALLYAKWARLNQVEECTSREKSIGSHWSNSIRGLFIGMVCS